MKLWNKIINQAVKASILEFYTCDWIFFVSTLTGNAYFKESYGAAGKIVKLNALQFKLACKTGWVMN